MIGPIYMSAYSLCSAVPLLCVNVRLTSVPCVGMMSSDIFGLIPLL